MAVHETKSVQPSMVIVVGEVAYDYGFYEGYFLYDLFFKNLTDIVQQYHAKSDRQYLMPFLVVPGPFDFA